MNYLVKLKQSLPKVLSIKYNFADKNWDDREKSAEKVFLNNQQKKTLEKLLNKIESSEEKSSNRQLLFQQGLKEILKRHHVSSAAFQAEVVNLHRSF